MVPSEACRPRGGQAQNLSEEKLNTLKTLGKYRKVPGVEGDGRLGGD